MLERKSPLHGDMKAYLPILTRLLGGTSLAIALVGCADNVDGPGSIVAPIQAPPPLVSAGSNPRWDQSPFGTTAVRYDPGQEAAGDAVIDSLAAHGASGQWV